jgi:DNA-directed RNA polymerase subunit M/transcription elongation factor TFIIS
MGDHLKNILEIAKADITSSRPERVQEGLDKVQDLASRIEELEKQQKSIDIKPLLDGHVLMDIFGKPPGIWIKKVQEFLIAKQLENPALTKEDAVKLVKEYMQQEKLACLQLYNNFHQSLAKQGMEESTKVKEMSQSIGTCPKCGEVLIPLGFYENDVLRYCPVCKNEILQREFPGQSSQCDRSTYMRGVPPVPIRS